MGCRAAHSCDKVGNSLYIFGGWNGKKALNDLYVLDLDKLICPTVDNSSSVPQPVEMSYVNQSTSNEPETFGPTPACRNNHTTAVHGDKIYFHGGHDGLIKNSKSCY